MKPKLLSFVVAEGVSVDQISGRITAFNMIDHFVVASLPCLLMRIMAVSIYSLGDEPDEIVERVRVLGVDGETITHSETPIVLGTREKNLLPNCHRSLHSIWNAKISHEGDHYVVLEHKRNEGEWESVKSLCFTVITKQNPLMNKQARYYKAPVATPPVPPETTPTPNE